MGGTIAKLYTSDPPRQNLGRVPFSGQSSVRVLRNEDVKCRYHDNNKTLPVSIMDGNPYFDTPRLLREAVRDPNFTEQVNSMKQRSVDGGSSTMQVPMSARSSRAVSDAGYPKVTSGDSLGYQMSSPRSCSGYSGSRRGGYA